jgi:hypothetical protein
MRVLAPSAGDSERVAMMGSVMMVTDAKMAMMRASLYDAEVSRAAANCSSAATFV